MKFIKKGRVDECNVMDETRAMRTSNNATLCCVTTNAPPDQTILTGTAHIIKHWVTNRALRCTTISYAPTNEGESLLSFCSDFLMASF